MFENIFHEPIECDAVIVIHLFLNNWSLLPYEFELTVINLSALTVPILSGVSEHES